jgi:hypothetical protein
MANIDLNDLMFRAQEELDEVLRVVQEKGAKHFQNAFAIAAGALVVSYILIYRSTAAKLTNLHNDINNEQGRVNSAKSYADLRVRLLDLYTKMPRPEKKDGWLFDRLLQTASAQGVVLDKIGSQTEFPGKDYSILTITITAHMTYAQMGKWLEAIENQVPTLLVTQISYAKPEGKPGAVSTTGPATNDVSMEISTVMPKTIRPL